MFSVFAFSCRTEPSYSRWYEPFHDLETREAVTRVLDPQDIVVPHGLIVRRVGSLSSTSTPAVGITSQQVFCMRDQVLQTTRVCQQSHGNGDSGGDG